MKTVAFAVFSGVQLLDLAGPMDVFAEANGFIAPEDAYRITLVGGEGRPVKASNGACLMPGVAFADASQAWDLVLVPGGPALPEQTPSVPMLDWLARVTPQAGRYGSICTGAFALGHAGLIDERRVTTHWQDAARLAQQFPRAQVEPDRIYVRDGALVTSAGVTAGIDLSLALVAEDHGDAVARAVAKRLLVFVQRQGGQSQFSPYLQTPADETSVLARAQRHVQEHLAQALSVDGLAEAMGMSSRNFARIFAREAGVTPAEFVQLARVDAARGLLEGSSLQLKAVAYRCGFGSAARMRQVFMQRLGVTPTEYRERFRPASVAP
jgi:transcriptional regulator GlxA family with amidase domain